MADKPKILIAGAGIGGLTASLALLKAGFDVEIYEQAPELAEIGAGFQMSANGTRVLYALGLGEAIDAIAWQPSGKEIRIWNTGQTWKLFDLGAESVARYGYPYLMFHRGDLHRVWWKRCAPKNPTQFIWGPTASAAIRMASKPVSTSRAPRMPLAMR